MYTSHLSRFPHNGKCVNCFDKVAILPELLDSKLVSDDCIRNNIPNSCFPERVDTVKRVTVVEPLGFDLV